MSAGLFTTDSPTPKRFVRVVFERAMDQPGGLTYSAPGEVGEVQAGDRVEAPLGRGDTPAAGFVVEVNVEPELDPARIKPIRRRTGLRLPGALVELARWIAGYYCCPLGVALGAMTPAAVKRGIGGRRVRELERTGAEPLNKLPPATAQAWQALRDLDADAFPITPDELARRVGAKNVAPINRLARIGLLREAHRRVVRARWGDEWTEHEARKSHRPTVQQQRIIDDVAETLGRFEPHLLFGVTGSGKTEVYLRLLRRVIDRGETAIVLVPEISLTPQTAGRFLAWFGRDKVAMLHSGLTAAQRHQEWSRIAQGQARLVVGARSAVFAPFGEAGAELGLIIVDEEHDGAYKQDEAPRYNARDVALKRGQLEQCPVLLGSATPSLESWRRAEQGRAHLHRLTDRVAGASLPAVQIVDLVEELRAEPEARTRLTLIGPTLRTAMQRTLEAGGQILLLLNRRGYANYICCADHRCGWLLTCRDCDTTLVYHRDRRLPLGGVMRCHHCLAERRLPERCPQCNRRVTTFGVGTQRIEEEISRLFPELAGRNAIMRLDADTMGAGRRYAEALSRFGSGEVRLILGTQMIAKGLDYPGVELVGVVNADTALNLPDFRAGERTFQLISQVAGRAGRSAQRPGRVIAQTFNPHEPTIQLAAAHDYAGFASRELELRRRAGLPPATRMARIVVRHEKDDIVAERARLIAQSLRRLTETQRDLCVRGPMPCPISRIAGRRRIAIELLAPGPAPIQRALTAVRNEGLVKSDALTAVDVDPIALL